MQISQPLAEQIASKAQTIVKRQLVLADLDGRLVAGDDVAPGMFSPEALAVAQSGIPQTAKLGQRSIKWWPFVYEDQTMAIFGAYLESGPITNEAMTLLQGLAEVIIYQRFLLDRVQSAEIVRADFIKQALTSPQVDVGAIYRQADILQLNLRAPQAIILIDVHGLEDRVKRAHSDLSDEERGLQVSAAADEISGALREGFKNFQDNLVAYLGSDRFTLIKGIGGESLTTLNTIRFMTEKAEYAMELLKKRFPGQEVTIGVGQYYPELQGLRKSYQDALLALQVGLKVWGQGQIYHIKRVGMFVTLANTSQDRKAELAHQILSPLLRDEQLFKTVQAFLTSGLNLTDAAEELHIHRNTLIYRLDKTKKLIGLDPRHFDDALQIKLGLMFYQQAA